MPASIHISNFTEMNFFKVAQGAWKQQKKDDKLPLMYISYPRNIMKNVSQIK